MYTKRFKQYITAGWCSYIIGSQNECNNDADKCWLYLDEDKEMKLEVVLALPVCKNHVHALRYLLAGGKSYLQNDQWELVDRDSASWSLVIDSLE